jgi:hypothetical protein
VNDIARGTADSERDEMDYRGSRFPVDCLSLTQYIKHAFNRLMVIANGVVI